VLKNVSIGSRLAIGFGLIVLFLITMALTGYWGLQAITHETLSVLGGDARVVVLAARVKATTLELRRSRIKVCDYSSRQIRAPDCNGHWLWYGRGNAEPPFRAVLYD
jgi:hypothetical protein